MEEFVQGKTAKLDNATKMLVLILIMYNIR